MSIVITIKICYNNGKRFGDINFWRYMITFNYTLFRRLCKY